MEQLVVSAGQFSSHQRRVFFVLPTTSHIPALPLCSTIFFRRFFSSLLPPPTHAAKKTTPTHEPLPSLSSRKHPLLVPSHVLGFLHRRHTGACRPAQRPPDRRRPSPDRRRHRPGSLPSPSSGSPPSPSESPSTSRRPGSPPSGSPLSPGHGGGGRRHPEARGGGLPGRPLRGAAGEAGPVLTVLHRGLGRRPRHQHGVRPRRGAPVRLPRRRSAVASDVPVMNTPANSTEWAELIVKEMSSASDLNDARNRVFRILEMFDKCAANCSTPDEAHKMREVSNC